MFSRRRLALREIYFIILKVWKRVVFHENFTDSRSYFWNFSYFSRDECRGKETFRLNDLDRNWDAAQRGSKDVSTNTTADLKISLRISLRILANFSRTEFCREQTDFVWISLCKYFVGNWIGEKSKWNLLSRPIWGYKKSSPGDSRRQKFCGWTKKGTSPASRDYGCY